MEVKSLHATTTEPKQGVVANAHPAGTARLQKEPEVTQATSQSGLSHQPKQERRTSKQPKSSIKSVEDWQKNFLATGMAPSAKRCAPLKGPIPSKYWGDSKDPVIPDFHRLVNYPDYLTKSRPNGVDLANSNNGKRNCVMCGKLRLCSAAVAAAAKNGGSSNFRAVSRSKSQSPDGDEDDTTHIIPRQNKGLCTACDITVWVILETNLEIKWCKGCKNFRPWSAFGCKGSATKCARCRDRQREKYAMQKEDLRQKRLRKSVADEKKEEHEADALAAAKGLRELMAARV